MDQTRSPHENSGTASSLLSSPTAAIADAISAMDVHMTVLVVTDDLFG
jgi:hypothetical protein